MTRRQRILLAALGLGACALLADRLAAEPEDRVVESAAEEYSPVAQTPAAANAALQNPSAPLVPLSERIRKAVQVTTTGNPTRDIFQIAPAWIGVQIKTAAPVAGPSPAALFEQGHQLTGVVVAGRRSVAIIDGTAVKLGETVDGFRLVSVAHNLAILESEGGRAILRIEEGAQQASPGK